MQRLPLLKKIRRKAINFFAILFGFFSTYYAIKSFADYIFELFTLIPATIFSFIFLLYLFPYSLLQEKAFVVKGYLLGKLLPAYLIVICLNIILTADLT
tara:strand:- start:5572 stop:5868 length:297 start_codon:yes stop_codon:yes gene_type:complete